jgi:hypothetical protein
VFTPYVRKTISGKIVLIWDGFSGHQDISPSDKDIELLILPPNLTSVHRPLDQGIIRSLKCLYRIQLTNDIVGLHEGINIYNILKQHSSGNYVGMKTGCLPNLLEAMELFCAAWQAGTTQETIISCFRKARILPIHLQGELEILGHTFRAHTVDLAVPETEELLAVQIMSAFKGITPSSSLIAVTGATILFEPDTLAKEQDIMKWLLLEETEEVKLMHTQEIIREYEVTTGAPVPRQAETKPIPIVTQDSDQSDHEQLSLTNRKKMEDIDCNELEDIARRCAVNDFTKTGRLIALAWTSLKKE